jgi:hypothetical protein
MKKGPDYEYVQVLNDVEYKISHKGNKSEGFLDGKKLFDCRGNGRIITDLRGKILKTTAW